MIYWITGASSGIGKETSLQLVRAGHIVIATARGENALADLEREAKPLRGALFTYVMDVTDKEAVQAVYNVFCEAVGIPESVVLNAGTYVPTDANTLDTTVFRDMFEVNFFGVLNCIEAVMDDFKSRRRGQLAIVSSLAGYRGLPNAGAYGASKAALINLAESLKEDIDRYGIDLRLINPGFVKTPLTDKNEFPMPFLMPVEGAAAALVKGLDRRSFEICFPYSFAFWMKLLRILPNALFLRITRLMIKNQ